MRQQGLNAELRTVAKAVGRHESNVKGGRSRGPTCSVYFMLKSEAQTMITRRRSTYSQTFGTYETDSGLLRV